MEGLALLRITPMALQIWQCDMQCKILSAATGRCHPELQNQAGQTNVPRIPLVRHFAREAYQCIKREPKEGSGHHYFRIYLIKPIGPLWPGFAFGIRILKGSVTERMYTSTDADC